MVKLKTNPTESLKKGRETIAMDKLVLQLAMTAILAAITPLILTTETFGQSDAPFANCILFKDDGYNVILQIDEDCNDEQFSQAVSHYKSHGYDNEAGYSDIFGTKQIHLKSDKPF